MNKKYIIKNCPNCLTYNRPKAICGLTYKTGGFKGETTSYKYCQDCTDCLLKRIVEKCKGVAICDVCNLQGTTSCDARMCTNFYLDDFARELLDMLEIEECE